MCDGKKKKKLCVHKRSRWGWQSKNQRRSVCCESHGPVTAWVAQRWGSCCHSYDFYHYNCHSHPQTWWPGSGMPSLTTAVSLSLVPGRWPQRKLCLGHLTYSPGFQLLLLPDTSGHQTCPCLSHGFSTCLSVVLGVWTL